MLQTSLAKKPIVVWNSTRRCNLKCVHCYASSENHDYPNELTTVEAEAMVRDLGEFKAPVLLFSGGEPFIREDMYDLAALARELGIRPVISTNGTLITEKAARRVKDIGFGYVGISLDGISEVNDSFRGVDGAFKAAMRGFDNCVAVGQKCGLRLTLTRQINGNSMYSTSSEAQDRPRLLLPPGLRAGEAGFVRRPSHGSRARRRSDHRPHRRLHRRGLDVDILTVDNHCDGPYLYCECS